MTVTATYRGYTVAIEEGDRPLDPAKKPQELLNDKRVKLLLLADTGAVLGAADAFGFTVNGMPRQHRLACPLTNLRCMLESINAVSPVVNGPEPQS